MSETNKCSCDYALGYSIGHRDDCELLKPVNWQARAEAAEAKLQRCAESIPCANPKYQTVELIEELIAGLVHESKQFDEQFDRASRAESELTASRAEVARLKWLIGQVLGELPTKRDWLNPDIEREMKSLSPAEEGGGK